VESSRYRQHFITHEVQSNSCWDLRVKEECGDGFANILTKLFPRVALGEDVFRKALGAVTPIRFLNNFENQFVHIQDDSGVAHYEEFR
jgi:hypothetical protein